jgi:hypothetical protein
MIISKKDVYLLMNYLVKAMEKVWEVTWGRNLIQWSHLTQANMRMPRARLWVEMEVW